MDFVLTLHSHLPYVLHHGRWPHGSDGLCEAAVDTYLPLLEQLQGLALEGTAAPVTIGFTPVLANQLASPTFAQELEAFFDQREAACKEAPASLAATRDSALLPLVEFWQSRFGRLRSLFHSVDSNILAAFRRLQDGGQLEIIGSAATHGYLPLLARDESIRLQLVVGRNEYRRLFGRDPVGCWLPECAYRPRQGRRPGIEEQLAAAGFRYFFTDAHLAQAGDPLGSYGEVPLGAERFDADRPEGKAEPAKRTVRSPYQAYRVSPPRAKQSVAALVRDPRSSMQVWSRHHGYPGDEWYLEFHKIRWPGGLKLWRGTGPGVDLGAERAGEPPAAPGGGGGQGRPFAHLLAGGPAEQGGGGGGGGGRAGPPFRALAGGHRVRAGGGGARGERSHRRTVRYGAVRSLVVRGRGLPGGDLPRAAPPCRRAPDDRGTAPGEPSRQRRAAPGGGLLGRERRSHDVAQRPHRGDLAAAARAGGRF